MATFSAMISLLFLFISVSSPPFVNGGSLPDPQCYGPILHLVSCLPYLTTGSPVDQPKDACCAGLKSVLNTNPECLCEGLKNSGSFGLVNVTRASTLAVACNLDAPPASACGLLNPPSTPTPTTPAPVPAPAPAPAPAPVTPPAPSPCKTNYGSHV